MLSQWCASTDYIEIKRPADREKQRSTSDETQREQYKSAIQWWISSRWFCSLRCLNSHLAVRGWEEGRQQLRTVSAYHYLQWQQSIGKRCLFCLTVIWNNNMRANRGNTSDRRNNELSKNPIWMVKWERKRSLWLMSAQVEISTSRSGRNVTTDAQWQMDRQEQKLPFPGLHNHSMAASKWHCLIIGTGCCCAYFDSSQNSTGCEQWRVSLR